MAVLAKDVGAAADSAHFRLQIAGLPANTLRLERFRSESFGLSGDYAFHIHAVAGEVEIDVDELLGKPATLCLSWAGSERFIHGVLAHASRVGATADGAAYKLLLASPLWALRPRRHNRVFLGRDVTEIVAAVLQDAGFAEDAFDYELTATPPPREFVVQYDESDYDFLQRQLAYHGVFFALEQGEGGATLVLTDSADRLAGRLGAESLDFQVPTGQNRQATTVYDWQRRLDLVTAAVSLKDYNPDAPRQPLKCESHIGGPSEGGDYRYGECYGDQGEGDRLAGIRAEAIACQRDTVVAQTDCRALMPGMHLKLSGHPEPRNDGSWLVVEVESKGDQRSGFAYGGDSRSPAYSARLQLLRVGTPYRTEPQCRRRRVHGMFPARIEGDGGDYAYLDEQGRYRLRMPFDRGDAATGEASHGVRAMQPYGGNDYGMHFPLHDGAEVLAACLNGDVDRPVIVGGLYNADSPSPVNGANPSQNILRTWGGNELLMEDRAGRERIELFTRDRKNRLSLDAKKDGHEVGLVTEDGDMELRCGRSMHLEAGDNQAVEVGADQTVAVQNAQRLMTKEGPIEVRAAKDYRVKAGEDIRLHAETADIQTRSGRDTTIESGANLSVQVRRGDASVLVSEGSVAIQAAKSVTVHGDGGGRIHIGQAGGRLEVSESGDLIIEGPTIEITANTIKVDGAGDGNN